MTEERRKEVTSQPATEVKQEATEQEVTVQETEEFIPENVPYAETVKAVKSLFDSQAVTAGAINRLETFVFSITKILKDEGTLSLEKLGFLMDELVKHQTLETFWEIDPDAEPEEVSEEAPEVVVGEADTEG